MFEQQIEETISSIKRRTIGENASIPLKAVLAADIPQAVKTYFNLDVKQWMKEEHDRLLNSPHFDYSDEAVRLKFRDIEQHSKPMIRFTESEFDTVLDQAVKLHFNYICRPQWTLSKFVFGEKDLVTSDAILDALGYFVEFEYFRLIIKEYLDTKDYTSMHRDRFEELVSTIDNEVTKGFDSRKMAQLAQPIFEVFSGESETAIIPIEALSVFYDDKNISPIVERLDAEKDTMPMLSMHDLTVLISEVDFSTSVDISNLVNRHLYPEKQPPPQRPEPSDEEITRSIIAESRGEAATPRTETPAPPPEDEPLVSAPTESGFDSLEDVETAPEEENAFLPEIEEEQESEVPLPDFRIEEQPAEENLPSFEDVEPDATEEAPSEEESLSAFSFDDAPESAPLEEADIPSFHHIPDEDEEASDVDDNDFSFSFGEEAEEGAPSPTDEVSKEDFGNFSFSTEATEEQAPTPTEDEDMETPEAFQGFTLSPDEEEQDTTAEEAAQSDDIEMPEEFEGFTLAPDDELSFEGEPPSGEHEVPEFPDIETEPAEEALPGFADADDISDGDEKEASMFDDFLPVEDDTTPESSLPVEERLEESPLDDSDENDINLDFSLDDETETIQDKESDSFDSFLSDLDDGTAPPAPPAATEGDDLSFLNAAEEGGAASPADEMEFINEDAAATPGDEFSFDNSGFEPPESDISFEESGKLVNEEQKNEYSTEDETEFTEFEFEPPDDESLILPELDLSLDENEAEMVDNDTDAGGFDFGEALVAEQEEEAKQNEMKDLMKDFARDQSLGPDPVDDPINTLGDLKQTIPAKDRKLYIKTLFNKDEEAFEAALNELNRKPAWRQASEYIDELFIEHDVDMYSKVAIKFTDEIYKRYMPKG